MNFMSDKPLGTHIGWCIAVLPKSFEEFRKKKYMADKQFHNSQACISFIDVKDCPEVTKHGTK